MDEVKNYPPYLDYPKPYKAEVSTDCINRKAFIGEIEKHYCAPCKGQDGDLGGDWCHSCVINSVLEKVREFPAADVMKVRHGKWIQPHWKNSNYCCSCSECGGEAMHADYQWDKNGIYPICPNCGAKMDKENAWKDDALGQKED